MVRSKNFFMKFYLALIIAFLYIPIAVLVVLSFNDSRSRVVWGGFTLEWYKTLFHNSCLLYTSPSPRDRQKSRMPSSA